jgi:hypothetical protein
MSLTLVLIAGVAYLIVGALLSRVSLRVADRYSSLMEDGSIMLLTSWKTSLMFPHCTFFSCHNLKDWKQGKRIKVKSENGLIRSSLVEDDTAWSIEASFDQKFRRFYIVFTTLLWPFKILWFFANLTIFLLLQPFLKSFSRTEN